MEGVFELDGEHLVIDIDDMISSSGYSMVVTPAEDDAEAVALKSGYSKLYEAEKPSFQVGRALTEAADIMLREEPLFPDSQRNPA